MRVWLEAHLNKSGIILIVVGSVLLAHNFGLVSWDWLSKWWPLLLIGLGAWSIVSHRRGDNETGTRSSRTDKQS